MKLESGHLKINEIQQGDCFEFMKLIPDKSVDAIISDPPYQITSNQWDTMLPLDKMWEAYKRIIKPNGVIALTASQPFSSMLVMSNIKMFKHEWIWIKNQGGNFANTVREPFKEHEQVLIFSNGKWTYNKQMQERTGSGLDRVKYDFNHITASENYRVFDRPPDSKNKKLRVPSSWQKINVEKGFHPTQKPLKLFEYLIKTYTNEGELVLDNCAGSFTTAVACKNLKRNWICIEKEEKYCKIGKERLDKIYDQDLDVL